MTAGSFTGLLNNAILLLALVVVYDVTVPRLIRNRYQREVVSGLLIGVIGMLVMLNPWELKPGVFFDSRWIILGLCGLYFGIVPTLIALCMTVALRVYQGGAGIYVGSLVLIVSAIIGLEWRQWTKKQNKPLGWLNLYLMGLVTQIAVLACISLMPASIRWEILSNIAPPLLLVFPIVTMLLGLLLGRQKERDRIHKVLEISENRFRNIFESSDVCIWNLDYSKVLERFEHLRRHGITDLSGYLNNNKHELVNLIRMVNIVQVNDACLRLFKAESRREFFGSKLKLFTPDVLNVFRDHLSAMWEGNNYFRSEVNFKDLNGDELFGIISLKIPEKAEDFTSIPVSLMDITESKISAEKVVTLSQAVEQSPVTVVVTDPKGAIEYVNSTFEEVTGYSATEVMGKNPRVLKSGKTNPEEYKKLWETISSGRAWRGEFHNLKKNGDFFWEFAHIAPVLDEQGKIRHYIAVKEDITYKKEQEELILHQAHFDSLTDLPNRFLSLDRLSQLIKEADRNNTKVGVLFMDLDDFKKVNDSLGHDTGDQLLVQAAERLKHSVRDGDTIGRLGGDEFIMLMGGMKSPVNARPAAENLLDKLRTPFRVNEREMILTASIGIAIYPDDGETPIELLRKADTAMYCSKQEGRNTYNFFTESMNHEVSRRLLLEELLHGALERGEFSLCYQPIIDIEDRKIIGTEALLRWDSPMLGRISPDEFVPITEQTGLIIQISKYVLREAMQETARWQQMFSPDFRLAVNLSPCQFRDPYMIEDIERIMKTSGISHGTLVLEITEGLLLGGIPDTENLLYALSKLDIGIAMDDFGTGYSSLSYLRQYPFNSLKIDRNFISDIAYDQSDRELINAAIVMAHSLDLKVVAEGVETEDQYSYLNKQGCDYVQGYLFSQPVTADKIDLLLSKQHQQV